jgi:hypothetical protein
MTSTPKIRGDKLVLATVTVLRTLIIELDRAGAMSVGTFLAAVHDSVAAHREAGDPNQLADAIQAIAAHLRESVSTLPRSDH